VSHASGGDDAASASHAPLPRSAAELEPLLRSTRTELAMIKAQIRTWEAGWAARHGGAMPTKDEKRASSAKPLYKRYTRLLVEEKRVETALAAATSDGHA
jgi:hypothetical protein